MKNSSRVSSPPLKEKNNSTLSESITMDWTNHLQMQDLDGSIYSNSLPNNHHDNENNHHDHDDGMEVNIASFNILAESYTTPRSHRNLPQEYAASIFDPVKRRKLVVRALRRLILGPMSESKNDNDESAFTLEKSQLLDVVCLQELDEKLKSVVVECMAQMGFDHVHAPRDNGAHKISSTTTAGDGCAIFYSQRKYAKVGVEVVRFDDLADIHRPALDVNGTVNADGSRANPTARTANTNANANTTLQSPMRQKGKERRTPAHALTGIVSSYRRRNSALLLLLQRRHHHHHPHSDTHSNNAHSPHPHSHSHIHNSLLAVACTHLYWHPGYEYVKLSQAKYLLHKLRDFAPPGVPVILCGDFNSKPGSAVHRFLTVGKVDARKVAPWYKACCHDDDDDEKKEEEEEEQKKDSNVAGDEVDDLNQDPIVPLQNDNDDNTFDDDCDDSNTVTNGKDEENNTNHDALLPSIKSLNLDPETSSLKIYGGTTNKPKTTKLPSYESVESSTPQEENGVTNTSIPNVRYLLDMTLNKFTRWLRILGLDAALETEEEEKARTRDGIMAIFQRCKNEKRILITTSYKLLLRKDCPPGSYLINPQNPSQLESYLTHLLKLHNAILQPNKFLTRCVVCNGRILDVGDDEQKRREILEEFGGCSLVDSTDLMEGIENVYQCDGCGQGYWWSDEPGSSASRVKEAAAHLFRVCLRGGVAIEGTNDFLDYVNVEDERRIGREEREKRCGLDDEGGRYMGTGGGVEQVMSWLKEKELGHPFHFKSAYAFQADRDGDEYGTDGVEGEMLPFTNVTSDFVDTLDYILYQPSQFELTGRLYVPTSFREMNGKGIPNGHLLPSDIWPSDHLAIGARLRLKHSHDDDGTDEKNIGNLIQRVLSGDVLDNGHGTSVPKTLNSAKTTAHVSSNLVTSNVRKELNTSQIADERDSPLDSNSVEGTDDRNKPCVFKNKQSEGNRIQSIVPPPNSMHVQPNQPLAETVMSAYVPPSLQLQLQQLQSNQQKRHEQKCDCGCVPEILSLFEMAELRKQARLKRQQKKINTRI